ncbi:arylesterase [Spirochaetia bacterium]|nr:arylesterase [Spirochaetia bacterium]
MKKIMKKTMNTSGKAGIVVIGILAVLFLTGNGVQDIINGSGPIVCFGDSLTAGMGASIPGADDRSKAYPGFLQKKVKPRVINAGISGDTVTGALARVYTDVLANNPRMVIVCIGGNDVLANNDILITYNNLAAILNILNDGRRKIYLAKFYNEATMRQTLDFFGLDLYVQNEVIHAYDTMFTTLASTYNVELINDIWSGVWGIHMSDAIHPDAAGYEIMAEHFFNAIKPYLEANNLLR